MAKDKKIVFCYLHFLDNLDTGWDVYFLLMAKLVASRSTCSSRPNGAVIVRNRRIIATGYNGAGVGQPHCIDVHPGYCKRREVGATDGQKDRFCVAIHAEANAIAQAALYGICVKGAVVYCTMLPCPVCIKLLAQSGIVGVYYEYAYDDEVNVPTSIQIIEKVEVAKDDLLYVWDHLHGITSMRRLEKTE